VDSLQAQIRRLDDPSEVEVLSLCDDMVITIGAKRNRLLDMAQGEYLCFIDDDDRVLGDYISLILMALRSKPDCVGIKVLTTFDGGFPELREFRHGNRGNIVEKDMIMHSPPYHINPIRATIAKSVRFPDTNSQEDAAWAAGVQPLIKSGVAVPNILYHYNFSKDGSLSRRNEQPNSIQQPAVMQSPRARRRRIWRGGAFVPHPDERIR